MAKPNYNLTGLNINPTQIASYLDGKRRTDMMERQEQRALDSNKLYSDYINKRNQDPSYEWGGSAEERQIAALNPEYLDKIRKYEKEIGTARTQLMFDTGYQALVYMKAGNPDAAKNLMNERAEIFKNKGIKATDTNMIAKMLNEGEIEKAEQNLEAFVATGVATGRVNAANPMEYKTFAPVVGPDGKMRVVRANEYGIQTKDTGLKGTTEQEKANIDIYKTYEKEGIKGIERFRREKATAISESQAGLNNSISKINRALTLMQQANTETGITEELKYQLTNLFPNLTDPSNPAQLRAAFKQLAIDELQMFKGPTTDYEFKQVASVAGEGWNSTQSNVARAKALSRLNYLSTKRNEFMDDYLRNTEGRAVFGVENEWAKEYKRKQFEYGDSKYSIEDLQKIAQEQNLTMEELGQRLGVDFL